MSLVITRGELEYQAGLLVSSQSYKVFLAATGSLTGVSAISAWEAAELAASNGYAAVTGTVGSAVFNAATGRVEAPVITGQFGPGSGTGFQFDAMVIKLGTVRTAPYALRLYSVPQLLASGQVRGFQITLGAKP